MTETVKQVTAALTDRELIARAGQVRRIAPRLCEEYRQAMKERLGPVFLYSKRKPVKTA
jgi:hypothetical protein